MAVEVTHHYFNWDQQWLLLTVIGVLLASPAWRWLPRPNNSAIQTMGILLPTVDHSLSMALFSAALFGGTFIGIASLVLTMAGRYYPTDRQNNG